MSNTTDPAEVPEVDNQILAALEPVTETWMNGRGKRLYKLFDPVAEFPTLYAMVEHTRDIADDTGELVESETILDIGHITPTVSIQRHHRRILERLQDDNPELWDELDVEMMCEAFESYLEDRLSEMLDVGPDPIDICLLKELRIPIDAKTEADKLDDGTFSSDEWEAFLWAVESETTYIDRLGSDEGREDYDKAYAFIPEFEKAPDWRLRAAEDLHCGVFKGSPALANVAALLRAPNINSQSEIAKTLDKGKSTVSRQVDAVTDMYERAEWTAENR